MRSLVFQAAMLIASTSATKLLGKRQNGDGAFVPDTTVVETCADSGPGYLDCGTDYCYNPGIGETCCTEGYFCPFGSFCLGGGLCCPEGTDEATCLAENGLTAIPTFSSFATATGGFFDSGSTATNTASTTTRRATTISAGGSSATQAAGSDGRSGQFVGIGAMLAAVGGAALVL